MSKRQRRFDALDAYLVPRRKRKEQSLRYICWHFLPKAVTTSCLVLLVYFFSISLMFYNQKCFHIFKNPLSITVIHLIVKFIMTCCIRHILSCYTGKERTTLSWSVYVKRLALPGVAGSLDVGLSNWGLEFLTISLYSMTRSTSVIFIFGFAIFFKLERLRCSLVIVVLFIAMGLALFTFGLTQFSMEGFLLVLTASFLSGLRWTLSQIIMQKDEIGLSHPLDMMYHIQPWMMLALVPLAVCFEGVHFATSKYTFGYTDINFLLKAVATFVVGGMLGFMLEMSEFLLLKHTSGLTLTVAAVFRKLCVLLLAVMVNGDKMNKINILGLVICLGGVCLHVVLNAVYASERLEQNPVGTETQALLQDDAATRDNSEDSVEEEDKEKDADEFDVIIDR